MKSHAVSSLFDRLETFHVGRVFLEGAADRWDTRRIERHIGRILEPGGSYLHIDVGAFAGDWSKGMAQRFPRSRSLMIEANPFSAGALSDRLTEFPSGSLVLAVAVTERDGDVVNLHVTRNPVGTSLRTPRLGQIHEWTHVAKTVRVQGRRLDSILQELGEERLGVLKVDAQGADLEVLRSVGHHLNPSEIPAVVVELNFRDFYQEQDPWWKCVAHLQSCGYSMVEAEFHRDAVGEFYWADALFAVPR